MKHVQLSIAADGIATLTLDNADESMNVVNDAFLTDMEHAIQTLAAEVRVTGVILRSAKRAFMAGADLKQLVASYGAMTPRQAYDFSQRATQMHRAIERSGKPWVAVINGVALGGGFELALACHYRILVDEAGARVGLPEVNVGLLPGSGGTIRLALLTGSDFGLDLLLSGRAVDAKESLKLRIVDELATPQAALERARSFLAGQPSAVKPWDQKGWVPPQKKGLTNAEDSAKYSAATAAVAAKGYNAPASLAILCTVFEGLQLPFDKALSVESKYFARLLTNPVARNIIRTTFISKQAAEKGARRPPGVPRSAVTRLGVLGAGMMGAGIAYVAAAAGIEVILIDREQAVAEKGKAYSSKVQDGLVKRGRLEAAQAEKVLARITPTTDFSRLTGCELVIEAVFEDTAIKAEVTRRTEGVVAATTLIASNTSTLPISRLAEATKRPDQFIGLHFFSPVDRMGLVEVILGKQTSAETLARSLDFIAQLRKTPIVVNDSRGFYTSRVFQTLIHEGAAMVGEGVPAAVIENAAKATGLPTGPLALLDEVTLDLPLKIIDQAIAEEGSRYTVPCGEKTLRRMRDELGRGGRRAGRGFYDYPEGGKKQLWSGLGQAFPVAAQYDYEELQRRFLYIQALETARCLEERVLETAEDADLGALYGWGFPTWTGGTISYIDTIGLPTFVAEAARLAARFGERFQPSTWLRERAARGEGFYPGSAASTRADRA
jgi:3-hydroxyacyl-CoA dehydrogenase/enoyl-CoA hydratase/3-hydroxybutyryl-CoA epimerase